MVMADDTPPAFASGYPRLTALNGSALLLEVVFASEAGAVVFALRPGTAAAAAAGLGRAGVQAAAGWTPFARRSYPALGRGAAVGLYMFNPAHPELESARFPTIEPIK